jgi:alanine racemase
MIETDLSTKTAIIDLDACIHNIQSIRHYIGRTTNILACIKANAYGHTLLPVAKALENFCQGYAVSSLDEAISLRKNNIAKPIVLLSTNHSSTDFFETLAEFQIDTVLFEQTQLLHLKQAHLCRPLRFWLKINSGLNRFGFSPSEIPKLFHDLDNIPQAAPAIFLSHFASAESSEDTTQQQFKLFNQATENYPNQRSIANSAAIFKNKSYHLDWVRPGISLFGYHANTLLNKRFPLIPVMHLKTKILCIYQKESGDLLGYNHLWKCTKSTRIAIIDIGYADGFPRATELGTPIYIHNIPCPLISRVTMDCITVDISHCPQARIGDDVTIWGPNQPNTELAARAHSSSYELLCRVGSRVKFEFRLTHTEKE